MAAHALDAPARGEIAPITRAMSDWEEEQAASRCRRLSEPLAQRQPTKWVDAIEQRGMSVHAPSRRGGVGQHEEARHRSDVPAEPRPCDVGRMTNLLILPAERGFGARHVRLDLDHEDSLRAGMEAEHVDRTAVASELVGHLRHRHPAVLLEPLDRGRDEMSVTLVDDSIDLTATPTHVQFEFRLELSQQALERHE